MNITSKPKKSLKETYESVKKTLSLFLKKLGLKDNTAIKIEKNIEKKIKQEILHFEKEHLKLKQILDVLIPEKEPDQKSLSSEILDQKEQMLVMKIKKKMRFNPTNPAIFSDTKKGTIVKLKCREKEKVSKNNNK